MTRDEKLAQIENLTAVLNNTSTIYLADIASLDAVASSNLRRASFGKGIKLNVVKNTLLKQAMDASEKNFDGLYDVLKEIQALCLPKLVTLLQNLLKSFVRRMTSQY